MKLVFKSHLVKLVAATSLVFSGAVFAQDDKAASLDELLQMVKNSKIAESREHQKREAEFRKDKANQARLLQRAENTKKLEEARSEKLEQKYKEQELLVQQKREQLEERLGSLKELFGHLTSTAGDMRANMEVSIVSAQLPGRDAFLAELIEKMNSETKLPSIEEIERLWYELQREITESGRVAVFDASVSDPSGNETTRSVVRVGNYNLLSDGKYLSFEGKTGSLSELPRQPSSGLLSAAADLQGSSSGFTKVGVDPTGPAGGGLLKALINSPSLEERWHQGRLVGYIITGVFVVAILISIFKFFALSGVSAKVRKQLKSSKANPSNPLGRVLKVAEDNPSADVESLELKLEEAVLKERPPIESWLNIIKIISMVAPLLGLLGTVTGMIQTFQAITVYGAGDPTAMAGGISGALVTTVLGLVVAIPTVLIHTFLNGKAKSIIQILDEQSAGIIAEKSER